MANTKRKRPTDEQLSSFCWRHDTSSVERMLQRTESKLGELQQDVGDVAPFPQSQTPLGTFNERDWWEWINSVQPDDIDQINALKRLVATCRIRLGSQVPHSASADTRLKILVSSVVYDFEDLLESVYALLDKFGYHVLMSHMGTVPVDPGGSAMESCLRAVDECDLFLGIILPRNGSGKETKDGLSITHRETSKAIEVNKPRWFLVHEHVAIARQLFAPFRVKDKDGNGKMPFEFKPGIAYEKTKILQDVRIIDMYELAMRHDIHEVADRTGNWVQTFGRDEDARLFAAAQFRRYRELLDKHLPKLEDVDAICRRIRGKGE